jgi:hypothetical protein
VNSKITIYGPKTDGAFLGSGVRAHRTEPNFKNRCGLRVRFYFFAIRSYC